MDILTLELITAYTLRCKSVTGRLAGKLEASEFNGVGEGHLALIWSVINDWKAVGNTDPLTCQVLLSSLGVLQSRDPATPPEVYHQAMSRAIPMYSVDITEAKSSIDYITTCTEEFMLSRRVNPLLEMSSVETAADANEILDQLTDIRKRSLVTTAEAFDMLGDYEEEDLGYKVPVTRMSWFNQATGGGLGPKDVCGIVGPSGGGKTTLAMKLGLEMATDPVKQQKVAYLCYENSPHPEYFRRTLGYVGGLHIDDVKNVNSLKQVPAEKRERFENIWKSTDAGNHFRMFDFTGKSGGVSDVEAFIEDRKADEWIPDVIIVDQYFYLLSNYMTLYGKGQDVRKVSQLELTKFTNLAASENVAFLILHQLTASLKKENPTRMPRKGEYAEDAAFDAWMQYCIGIGTAGPSHVVWAKPLKARSADDTTAYKLYLDGAHFQMWDVTHMYSARARDADFVLSEEAAKHKVSHQRQAAREQARANDELQDIEFPWDPNERPPVAQKGMPTTTATATATAESLAANGLGPTATTTPTAVAVEMIAVPKVPSSPTDLLG